MTRNTFVISLVAISFVFTLSSVAQQAPTEAPTGLTTPALAINPGSQSVSNGLAEPFGDTFGVDQQFFETIHDPSTGLGPVFNAASCVACHANPVTGAASQFTEIRTGHKDNNGNFVNPTVTINDGKNTIAGRSIVNDRAICAQAQEHTPDTETIHALRAVLSTLGDGFVEAIADSTLIGIAQAQPGQSNGAIHGEWVQAPLFEAPGQTRVGRFGWKDQHGSLLSFVADAYVNEMGVTSRLRMADSTSVCKITSDPEDPFDILGLEDIDHFAQFIRATLAPSRDTLLASTPDAIAGQKLFESVGCNICHVESITTAPIGTPLNAGTYAVQQAVANKIIHPFGDYLLHDIGTGDGIVQTPPQDTANKLRTVPLWGLRLKARFMHDLGSPTLSDAISRHNGEASQVQANFNNLTSQQKQQVLTFLNSL